MGLRDFFIDGRYEDEDDLIEQTMTLGNISVFSPKNFEEAEVVAQNIMDERAAIVNIGNLKRDTSQRLVDFLTGVVYGVRGKIQKLGPNVILCTPKSFGVQKQEDEETINAS